MSPDIAILLEASTVFNGARGVLFTAALAQIKLGLTNINIIANVNMDAAMRLDLLDITKFSCTAPRSLGR